MSKPSGSSVENSGVATSTHDGRIVVDVRKLLEQQHVREFLDYVRRNREIVRPEKVTVTGQGSAETPRR